MTVWQCARCHFDADGVFVVCWRRSDICTACAETLAARGQKWCRGCKRVHALDAFPRDAKSPDGRTARCSAVRAAKTRAWRQRNPDKIQAYQQATRAAQRERKRAWRQRNPDKVRAQYRRKYARNPGKFRARSIAYHAANRERRSVQRRARWIEQKLRLLRQIRGETP